MKEIKVIYTGEIERNPHGCWEEKGLYIDNENLEEIFSEYIRRKIKITIEEIP